MRAPEIYSRSKFPVYKTVLLTVHQISRTYSSYIIATLYPFPFPPFFAHVNHCSTIYKFDFFRFPHKWDPVLFVFLCLACFLLSVLALWNYFISLFTFILPAFSYGNGSSGKQTCLTLSTSLYNWYLELKNYLLIDWMNPCITKRIEKLKTKCAKVRNRKCLVCRLILT